MKKFLLTLTTILLLYLAATYLISGMILHTPERSLQESRRIAIDRWKLPIDSLLEALPPPEEVTIDSPVDEVQLSGWYFDVNGQEPADCAILFAHGYSDNRMSMVKYTPPFADCGCDMLLYDHRGHGQSSEAYASGGINEATDLLAAHQWLRERTGLADNQIGWYGESWGAATALIAAGRYDTDPAWVVAESPYADWETAITERGARMFGGVLAAITPGAFWWAEARGGFDIEEASPLRYADRIDVPVLLFHSLQDTLTAPEQSDLLAERIDPNYLTYHALDWGAWHAHNVVWRREQYYDLVGAAAGCPGGGGQP